MKKKPKQKKENPVVSVAKEMTDAIIKISKKHGIDGGAAMVALYLCAKGLADAINQVAKEEKQQSHVE